MDIKELKQIIKDLPDDMLVGGSGHYGEFLDCYEIRKGIVYMNNTTMYKKSVGNKVGILLISLEHAGDEPS